MIVKLYVLSLSQRFSRFGWCIFLEVDVWGGWYFFGKFLLYFTWEVLLIRWWCEPCRGGGIWVPLKKSISV